MPNTIALTPLSMLSWPEARADRALLDRGQRRGQAAGAQQQRELAALDRVHAGDLEVVAEHAADGRAVDDLLGHPVDVRRPAAFFSRERSMNTTAIKWPRFSWVFLSILAAPRLSRLTDTAGPSWVFGWNEASVS